MDNLIGTLSDKEIKSFCKDNKLIIDNFYESNIKQACYELRASKVYYDLADGNRRYNLEDNEYILIKPKQSVVIITMETLKIPDDMIGKVLTKGKLFSIGLLPVNTYADPGFYGNLGIVFYNFSNNYIKIFPRESIAKIEFSKLKNSVEETYNGQHGHQTGVWLVPENMILTEEEIKKDKRIKSSDEEIKLSYGEHISKVITRVFKFERQLIFAGISYFLFSLILITILMLKGKPIISPIYIVLTGVVSNVIFTLIVYFSTNIRS
jgi:dCTP deaminase